MRCLVSPVTVGTGRGGKEGGRSKEGGRKKKGKCKRDKKVHLFISESFTKEILMNYSVHTLINAPFTFV